jgi:hypothetical protein
MLGRQRRMSLERRHTRFMMMKFGTQTGSNRLDTGRHASETLMVHIQSIAAMPAFPAVITSNPNPNPIIMNVLIASLLCRNAAFGPATTAHDAFITRGSS